MIRKGPQRYSTETIEQAITKYESGVRLSVIARELGVQKSTVKYWLDNATKHLREKSPGSPVVARIQKRFHAQAWDVMFAALKKLKGKLDEASARDLSTVIRELFDLQAQAGALTDRDALPDKSMEKSEEIKITVQKFLQKREASISEVPKSGLADSPVEHLQEDTTEALPSPGPVTLEEANGAT